MKRFFEKFKPRDKGTIFRTILAILAIANQIVAFIGKTSFADNIVYQYISLAITIITLVITYWYNNNWTSMARLGEDVYDMVKDGKVTEEEVEEFKDKHKLPGPEGSEKE